MKSKQYFEYHFILTLAIAKKDTCYGATIKWNVKVVNGFFEALHYNFLTRCL